MEIMLDLLVELRDELGFEPRKLGAGGGLGIAYTRDDDPPTPRHFVETVRHALDAGCASRGLKVPQLVVEPGRSIAGPAGVALYTVGSIKDIPGVRRYVAVDGGMGDNIRPKLYGARYEAFLASGPERATGWQGHDRRQVLRVDRHPDHRHRDAGARSRATSSRYRPRARTAWPWRATTTGCRGRRC